MLEFSGFSSDIDQLSLTSTFHSVKQDGVLNMRACYSNDQTTLIIRNTAGAKIRICGALIGQ